MSGQAVAESKTRVGGAFRGACKDVTIANQKGAWEKTTQPSPWRPR